MLLAVDIGNTRIHCGLFRGDRLYRQWDLPERAGIGRYKGVTAVVLCSVVPKLVPVIKRSLNVPVLVLSSTLDLGIKIKYKRPADVGADRLANAVAAKYIYGAPAMVVDFGTATTIDVISRQGDYLGGVILPGVDMVRRGLKDNTALLPLVSLKRPGHILGQTTEAAIRSGLYYGIRSMVKQLAGDLKKELRFPQKTVIIGTGGYAEFLAKGMVIDPDLTLKGLKLVYERNRDKIYP